MELMIDHNPLVPWEKTQGERLPLLSTIVVCSTIAQLYRRYRMNMNYLLARVYCTGTTEKISWIYQNSNELNVCGRFQEPSRIKVRKCGCVEFEFLRRAG